MRITFSRRTGLYVVFRYSSKERDGLGFAIKRQDAMYFSERHDGYVWGFRLLGLYFRTFKRQEIKHHDFLHRH